MLRSEVPDKNEKVTYPGTQSLPPAIQELWDEAIKSTGATQEDIRLIEVFSRAMTDVFTEPINRAYTDMNVSETALEVIRHLVSEELVAGPGGISSITGFNIPKELATTLIIAGVCLGVQFTERRHA